MSRGIVFLVLLLFSYYDLFSESRRFADREYQVESAMVELAGPSGIEFRKSIRIRDIRDRVIGTDAEKPYPVNWIIPQSVDTVVIDGEEWVTDYSMIDWNWEPYAYLSPNTSLSELSELVGRCFSQQERDRLSALDARIIVRLLVNDEGRVIETLQSISVQDGYYSGSITPFFRIDRILKTRLTFDDHGVFKKAGVPWAPFRLVLTFRGGTIVAKY